MKDFIAGLQFLTRVHFVAEQEWSAESFGRSVKYFPVIGAIIGLCLVLVNFIGERYLPLHLGIALLLVADLLITGGLHFDGFMDTIDGLFSGRDRETMLKIMKDSRVGANGVMTLCIFMLLKWALLLDASPVIMPYALMTMTIVSRFAMVMGITLFPYARPEGIGKLFAQYAKKSSLAVALLLTMLLILPLGKQACVSAMIGSAAILLFARFAVNKLGGLTGDVYGAMTELTELIVLLAFVLIPIN